MCAVSLNLKVLALPPVSPCTKPIKLPRSFLVMLVLAMVAELLAMV